MRRASPERLVSRAHALELVLEPQDDLAVRARWQDLERIGVATPARHRGATHRPHLTVVTAPTAPDEAVLRRCQELWAGLLPLTFTASGLVLLGRRRLTLAELLGPPLEARAAQAELAHLWKGADQRPWVPHISLARRLTPDEAGRAIQALADTSHPAHVGPATRVARGLRWWNPDAEAVALVAGVAA